jgi:hypothetical protein
VKLAQPNFSFSGFYPGWITIGMILLVGCSSVPVHRTFHMPGIDESNSGNLTWPSLPEVPRYAFIGHLYGESNTNGEESVDGVLARVFAATSDWVRKKNRHSIW